jgi:hypothetical protein
VIFVEPLRLVVLTECLRLSAMDGLHPYVPDEQSRNPVVIHKSCFCRPDLELAEAFVAIRLETRNEQKCEVWIARVVREDVCGLFEETEDAWKFPLLLER